MGQTQGKCAHRARLMHSTSANTKSIISQYGIRPTKSLGQNFLNDNNIIEKIADAACIEKTDLIIEVGSGIGNMTRILAFKAGKVIAIEIDKHLLEALNSNVSEFSNVEIINADVLKMDFKDILKNHSGKIKVVANLPYYITSPVIMKFLEDVSGIDSMVFMVQKEVAQRIVAKPGRKDYGILTVAVQFYSEAEMIFDVPPHCFIPQPKVDSTVIRLSVREHPDVNNVDKRKFFRVVKAGFGQRRKTIVNSLCNSGCFQKSKEEITEILRGVGIRENQRAEELSILQFGQLAELL